MIAAKARGGGSKRTKQVPNKDNGCVVMAVILASFRSKRQALKKMLVD
jgi:hypothetical protein